MPNRHLPARDGFDDLGDDWEVSRPAQGKRRKLGRMPGTRAVRRYGLEHVPNGGVAYGVIEQGAWRQPKWTVRARRQRPRSVIYEKAGDGRVDTVAEAVAAVEARYAEVERKWLAKPALASARPNTSGDGSRPVAPRNASGRVPQSIADLLELHAAAQWRIAELEAEVAALRAMLRQGAAPGWEHANRGRAARADRHALAVAEAIARIHEECRGEQLSNEDIARALDGRVPTAAGRGGWIRLQVRRVLKRVERIRSKG